MSSEVKRVEAYLLQQGPGVLMEVHQLALGLVTLVPYGMSLVAHAGPSAGIGEEVEWAIRVHLDRIQNEDVHAVLRDFQALHEMYSLILRCMSAGGHFSLQEGVEVTIANTAVQRARQYFGMPTP